MSDYLQIVTWLIVIAGWLIVNSQHNKREDRREIYTRLNTLKEHIRSLEANAVAYHTDSGDPELSWKIKSDIQRLWPETEAIRLLDPNIRSGLLGGVRKAITLHNFDSSTHKKLDIDAEQIAAIVSATDKLTVCLDRSYSDRYYKSV